MVTKRFFIYFCQIFNVIIMQLLTYRILIKSLTFFLGSHIIRLIIFASNSSSVIGVICLLPSRWNLSLLVLSAWIRQILPFG
jgi:hypothetical protein